MEVNNKRSRISTVLLVIAITVAVLSMISGYMQSIEAIAQAELAKQRERAALIAEENSIKQIDRAQQQIKQLQEELEKCKGR